jgi:type II secretory pathway pseudopilin PulG
MSDPLPSPAAPPVRPRRRRWPYVAALLALVVLFGIRVYVYPTVSADSELQAAIAETDRLDPRWRLEDVEADRTVVPEAENSATSAMAAKQLLPKNWPYPDAPPTLPEPPDALKKRQFLADMVDSFPNVEPQRQLTDEQTTALRTALKGAAGALTEARKLANRTEGRLPITYRPDFISTLLPHTQDARQIAALLSNDALLRAQDQDPDGALASCRGALNAGRSIGDEPTLISQLVRIACRGIATRQAVRVLAQGEPSEAALRQFQELLEKEEPEPLLLIGMRGERAGMDRLMETIQSGKTKLSALDMLSFDRLGDQSAPSLGDDLTLWTPGSYKSQRAAMLRYMNRCVELAKLPPEQQNAPFQQLEATIKDQPVLVRLLVPALSKISGTARRSHAQLRCAIAAVAAERYRLAKGQWPGTLDELKKAGYVREAPSDPYDGQPLRWLRLDDGVEVYSSGPDSEDNGGKMDRQHPLTAGTDIGFRLWDVAKRRQPPVPSKPLPEPNEKGPPAGAGK